MFPAYVGMSPERLQAAGYELGVPRIRGDEPYQGTKPTKPTLVFPAYVGMSPRPEHA